MSISFICCRVYACTNHAIHVHGFPGQLPFDAAGVGKPWQLTVIGNAAVFGLPSSCACTRATYMLQKQAAADAGWDDNMDSDN